MAYDDDVAERVWAETLMLVPEPPGNDQALAHLQAALGRIAARLPAGAGRSQAFPLRKDAPKTNSDGRRGEPAYKAMAKAILLGEGGAYAGADLPGVLALVKLTAAGKPDTPEGGREKWLATVIDAGAEPVATFTRDDDATGRRYGLYERVAASSGGERAWVSEVTGTGQVPGRPAGNWKSRVAWALVAVAGFAAIASAASLLREGAALARAYDIFSGTDRDGAGRLRTAVDAYCKNGANVDLCGRINAYLPTDPPAANVTSGGDPKVVTISGQRCLTELKVAPPEQQPTGQADTKVADPMRWFSPAPQSRLRYTIEPKCAEAWSYVRAFDAEAAKPVFPQRPATQSMSLVLPLLGMMAAIFAVGWAVGLGGYRRLFGLWINGQYRFSLSSAQISLWTIMVLAPFAAITLLENALLAPELRLSQILSFSPEIPGLLFALMGITFTSTVIAKYILAVKNASADYAGDTGIVRGGKLIAPSAGLVKNDAPQQAAIMDFFFGEEQGEKDKLDISRFQNVLITLVLVVSYGVALAEMMGGVGPAEVLGALATPQPLFPQLPTVTGSFLALLLVSHAAYLLAKASEKPSNP
jgi:hypothetical protein